MKIECWSVVLESKSKKFFSNINVISWPTSRLKTPYNTENLSTLKTAKCSCLEILLAAPRVRVACGGEKNKRLSRIMFSMLLWTCIPHTQSRITSSCSLSALGQKEYSLTAHVTNLLQRFSQSTSNYTQKVLVKAWPYSATPNLTVKWTQ